MMIIKILSYISYKSVTLIIFPQRVYGLLYIQFTINYKFRPMLCIFFFFFQLTKLNYQF